MNFEDSFFDQALGVQANNARNNMSKQENKNKTPCVWGTKSADKAMTWEDCKRQMDAALGEGVDEDENDCLTGKWRELTAQEIAYLQRVLKRKLRASTEKKEACGALASLSMPTNFDMLAEIRQHIVAKKQKDYQTKYGYLPNWVANKIADWWTRNFDKVVVIDVGSKDGRVSLHFKNGENKLYFNEKVGFTTGASFECLRPVIQQIVREHPDAVFILVGAGGYIMGKDGAAVADLYTQDLPTDNAKASPIACGLQALLRDMRSKGELTPELALIPNRSKYSLMASPAVGVLLANPGLEYAVDGGGAQWQIWRKVNKPRTWCQFFLCRSNDVEYQSYKFDVDFESVRASIRAGMAPEPAATGGAGAGAAANQA